MHANRVASLLVSLTAAAALGQGTMTFSWTTDDTGDHDGVIEPGESAVLTLSAFMDPHVVMFAGAIYDIAGDAGWQSWGTVDQYTILLDELGIGPGTLNADNSITGIENFQFPPFFGGHNASNPIALYEVVWTPIGAGSREIQLWTENHITAQVYTDVFGNSAEYEVVIEPGAFTVVPGPGVVGVLGVTALAGLGAARRRRVEVRPRLPPPATEAHSSGVRPRRAVSPAQPHRSGVARGNG